MRDRYVLPYFKSVHIMSRKGYEYIDKLVCCVKLVHCLVLTKVYCTQFVVSSQTRQK